MTRTVLVVEDNPITRKVARVTLASQGYEVAEAETGAAAIEELSRRHVDLVLQDLALADMDGFELLDRVQSIPGARDIPFLAYTGLADTNAVRAAGFAEHLLKPVSPSRLLRAVRAHLSDAPAAPRLPSKPPSGESATRDRAWRAVGAMLARLTELASDSLPVRSIVADVLASFLDASGFSVGAAQLFGPRGEPVLLTQIGFPEGSSLACDSCSLCPDKTASSTSPAGREPIEREVACALHRIFGSSAGSSASSVLTVPLTLGKRTVGTLVLGSPNPDLPAEWSLLAKMVAGPIAQAIALAETVARLTASENKFRGIAESTTDGILVTDALGEITYANPSAQRIIGTTPNAPPGRRIDSVIPFLASGAWEGDLVRPDGENVPVETFPQMFDDPAGNTNRVYVLRDLSERARIEELAHLASHDPLTGLFNRRRFGDEMASRLADSRRYQTPGALLVIDLDGFKAINDTFGHQAGDVVLRAVGEVLRHHSRETDTAARLGGDEFAVLAHHTTAAGAQAFASKLLERISSMGVPFDGHTLRVGASIGVALFPAQGNTAEAIFAAADEALYESKHGGRGRVSVSERMQVAEAAVAAK